jgi:hypothetical protein
MPHITYSNHPFCPWPGCNFSIKAVDFKVENIPGRNQELLAAWYSAGVVGRCPGCGQYVLFTQTQKQCVADDPVTAGMAILPDDWYQIAYIES